MIILLIYWILSPILWILLPFFALFNPKIRHHWIHEKNSIKDAQIKINKYSASKIIIQFHASSLGEYEQLKPILKLIDRKKYFILLSFFSPTAYKTERYTPLADIVCYHPFDFLWSAFIFFLKLQIKYYITTRNDIWPSHLFVAKKMKINNILINANFYRETHYKSWLYRSFFKKVLNQFHFILTGSERLKKNLSYIVSEKKVTITGDSRLDRVLERKKNKVVSLPRSYFNKSKTLILGSLISSDYSYIFDGLKKYYPEGKLTLERKNQRIIIVPHEINQFTLSSIENNLNKLNFDFNYYSNINTLKNCQILIIDKIGLLAELYAYSDLAYIGGGFGVGVHSVLEPAVYNNAISFGPNFHIVDIAVNLLNKNLASVINNANDFEKFCTLMDNETMLNNIKVDIQNLIKLESKAAKKIIKTIFFND